MDKEAVYEAIYNKYIEPTKKKREDYVGIEIEMPIVPDSGEAVDEVRVHEVADSFIKKFGFKPSGTDADGAMTSAELEETGDILSFDCSYRNLELSFGKARSLLEVRDRFNRYYNYLNADFHRIGYSLTGMGVNPNCYKVRGVPIKNERYRMLYHYLSSYKKYASEVDMRFHDHPDFGTFTSASQIQLDVPYDRLIDVINVNGMVEPYKSMLFANSYLPDHPDYLCVRNMLWERSMQGFNPHNIGMFEKQMYSHRELVEYIGTQSIYCTMRDGRYIDFEPVPFCKYFERDHIEGEMFDGEKYITVTFSPEPGDIDYLRTFKFEDLTYRGTIEYRSSCCQPVGEAMVVGAFQAGINERISELKELFETDNVIYSHGFSAVELQRMYSMRKYPDLATKKDLSDQLIRILDISADGLKSRGFGEESLLEPLYARAEKLTNPSRDMLEGLDRGVPISEYVKRYGEIA